MNVLSLGVQKEMAVAALDRADFASAVAILERMRDASSQWEPVPTLSWPDSLTGGLHFTGYASLWTPGSDGHQRQRGDFEASLDAYLDTGGALTYRHDERRPLGRIVAAWEDATGLAVEGVIFPPVEEWHRTVRDAVRAGLVTGLSWAGVTLNPRAVWLGEICVTGRPAHPDARITTVEAL